MAEPYIGEIRMFAGSFTPEYWAECNGGILPISQNGALFALIGTMYGGNGTTTMGLPDLRGRFPMHCNAGPGLTPRVQGQYWGYETATLRTENTPPHAHTANAETVCGLHGCTDDATLKEPTGATLAKTSADLYSDRPRTPVTLKAGSVTAQTEVTVDQSGAGTPFSIINPFLVVRFGMALQGVFPPRP